MSRGTFAIPDFCSLVSESCLVLMWAHSNQVLARMMGIGRHSVVPTAANCVYN
jgi:hypothetical protein